MQNDIFVADTERVNVSSRGIDDMQTQDILRVINENDAEVALAVRAKLPCIAQAVDKAVSTLQGGGRVFYLGAGTSGRLGVLDASECPPTYGVPRDWFVGVIAGGDKALRVSVENAEDDCAQAEMDLKAHGFCAKDFLVGIAASGRTPYVLGGLHYAKQLGAGTALLACSARLPDACAAEIVIAVEVGPEVVTGSTRMKAGTAQKMVLNMLSTATLIRMGRVYDNLMVEVQPTNEKLVDRAVRMVAEIAQISYAEAAQAFAGAGQNVKVAVVMARGSKTRQQAELCLARQTGHLRKALRALAEETI